MHRAKRLERWVAVTASSLQTSACTVARVATLLGLVACVEPQAQFPCTQDCECRLGAERGRCEAAGFCSFDDTSCSSGRRYAIGASDELAGSCVQGTAWYVAPQVTLPELGTYDQPFGTLQQAVDAAVPGDTILVEDGTYGPGTADITQTVVVLGTFATADAPITLRAQHPLGAILDCDHRALAYIGITGAAYWTIDGFEIINGYSAGIFSNATGVSHITISRNHIHDIGLRDDTSGYPMMGVFLSDDAADCVVDGNFIENIGRPNDAGNSFDPLLLLYGPRMTVTNNVLTRALSGWHIETGGPFSGTIANNTFVGPNMYPGREGQLLLSPGIGDVTIANNIFSDARGAAIVSPGTSWTGGACLLDHNLVYGSALASTAFTGACTTLGTLADVDPQFVDPNVDYHLDMASPAIDAATPGTAVDHDGVCRPIAKASDIGAYEHR